MNGKYQYYNYLEDYLGVSKWAKITLAAETKLINNALDNGYTWSGNNSIPNYTISRQTISSKIKNINYNYQEELKEQHYIALSILKTDKLWEETYKYLNNKYDLTKEPKIFISGDGGPWIKGFDIAFPNAIYVLDAFHYFNKKLSYIFKKEPLITSIADSYLRNRMVDEFKLLVKVQIEKYPEQKSDMLKTQKFLIQNIEGIINQKHPLYKCPCSMEGHISNKYAKFITSRPHSYSENGLENVVQLLTMKANNIKLTEEIYHQFKTGESTYKKLNLEKFITNFRNQSNKIINNNIKYNTEHAIDNSSFTSKDNYRIDYFLSKRI